jgi:hypothetical protein
METDKSYLERRAREEMEAAARSSDPKVRHVHSELADRYRHAAKSDVRPELEKLVGRTSLLPGDFRILE